MFIETMKQRKHVMWRSRDDEWLKDSHDEGGDEWAKRPKDSHGTSLSKHTC